MFPLIANCYIVIDPAYSVGSVDKSVQSLIEPYQLLNQKVLLVFTCRSLGNPEKILSLIVNILSLIVNISNRPVRIKIHTTIASVHEVDNLKSGSDLISPELTQHLLSTYESPSCNLFGKDNSQLVEPRYNFPVLSDMCNAPSCYERLIELVLRSLRWGKCLCHLDDSIAFGKCFDQVLENHKIVFTRLGPSNLTWETLQM